MADLTTVRTGDWSNTGGGTTPWAALTGSGVGGVPAAGDKATMGTGHTVTATADVTVGTSPTTSPSGVVFNRGQLVINQGVTLTLLGSLVGGGSTGSNGVITNSGNILLDTSVGGFNYAIVLGEEHTTTAKLVCPGTVNNRPTVASTGSLYGRIIDAGYIGGGRVEADYTDFSRLGYTTTPAISFYISSGTDNLYLRNCTLDDCGPVKSAADLGATSKLIIQNTLWSRTNQGSSLYLFGSSPTGAGVRTIDNNRFDKRVECYTIVGLSFTNNLFGATNNIAMTGYSAALFQYNILNGNTNGPYTIDSCCYYYSSSADPNVHPIQLGQPLAFSFTNCVVEAMHGSDGDLLVGGPGSGSRTAVATGNLTLPNAVGQDIGELVSPIASGYTWTVDHNTVTCTRPPAGTESGVAVYGETWAGVAGLYNSIRSNYVYSPTGYGAVLLRHNTSTVSDPLVTPDRGDYNAGNNFITATGSNVQAVFAPGYFDTATPPPTVAMFTSTTGLGAHDIVCDANFVDPTRCLATFDTAYLGNSATGWATATGYVVGDIVSSSDSTFYGSATVNFRCITAHTSNAGNATNGKPGASATTSWRTNWELASVYRIRTSAAVYNASIRQATPRDYYVWVRAGYAPTNVLLQNAGHDGVTIGAIEYTAAASTSVGTIFLGDDDGLAIYLAGTTIYI